MQMVPRYFGQDVVLTFSYYGWEQTEINLTMACENQDLEKYRGMN